MFCCFVSEPCSKKGKNDMQFGIPLVLGAIMVMMMTMVMMMMMMMTMLIFAG